MHLNLRFFACWIGLLLFSTCVAAQQGVRTGPEVLPAQHAPEALAAGLPDAPAPQLPPAQLTLADLQPPAAPAQPQQPAPAQQPPAGQDSSSTQAPAAQQDAEKSQHDKAEEQLKQQEKQRVMGVMATFNTTRDPNAVPLSPAQKFKLYFRSETDPWPFLLAGAVSGIGQANNSHPEWGQGAQGYAKRFGGAYTDAFIGNFFGNAVLPSILREDPRYYQKGTGSPVIRVLWAASSSFWCKRDKGGWGPNYSNVLGNLIGSSIATLYYPDANPTVWDTISDGLSVTAEGIVGAEVIEFWPDLVRMHKRKQAAKLARAQAAADQKAKDNQKPKDVQK